MKKWLKTLLLSGFGVVLLFPDVVLCQDMSNKEIVRELKAVKKKHHHSVKGLDARLRNIELAYGVSEDHELAVGYQGSDDGGDLLPEKQYGFAVLLGGTLENTSLAFEYLYGEFENNDETSLLTDHPTG